MRLNLSRERLYSLLFSLLIFTWPTNLFISSNRLNSYVNGLSIDYLITKFYLSDVIIWLILATWLFNLIKKIKLPVFKPWMILVFALIIRQFFTPVPSISFWYVLKIIEMALLGAFLVKHSHLFKNSLVKKSIILTLIFQSALGIYQYITQSSLAGYLFWGEVNLANSIGLAKDSWWQTGQVLPYGTTPHPNILAGIIVILIFLLTDQLTSRHFGAWLAVGLGIITLFLTQSISAILMLVWGISLFIWSKIKSTISNLMAKIFFLFVPLLLILLANWLPDQFSISRRVNLQTSAIKMWQDQPLWGVGLNQFTTRVEEFSQDAEVVRFVQPVHHLGLLWLAETGVVGIIVLWIILKRLKFDNLNWLLMLVPIASLDHYLLTLQAGLIILALTISRALEVAE